MIPLAESLEEARDIFLQNASGQILCVKGNNEKVVSSYPEAEDFFS